jgi:hypothetical protein
MDKMASIGLLLTGWMALLSGTYLVFVLIRIEAQVRREKKERESKNGNTPRKVNKLLGLLLQFIRRLRLIFRDKRHDLGEICHLDGYELVTLPVVTVFHAVNDDGDLWIHVRLNPNV